MKVAKLVIFAIVSMALAPITGIILFNIVDVIVVDHSNAGGVNLSHPGILIGIIVFEILYAYASGGMLYGSGVPINARGWMVIGAILNFTLIAIVARASKRVKLRDAV